MSRKTSPRVVSARGVLWTALLAVVGSGGCTVGEPGAAGPPRVGDPLPAVAGVTLAGDSVTTDAYRGEGLLLNLWATWCPPCRAEMPYLQELQEEYADRGLKVVGLSVDDAGARDLVVEFLASSGVEYDILLDPGMRSMDRLGVLGLPVTYLVDPDGVVRYRLTGPVPEGSEAFLARVEEILPEPGADDAVETGGRPSEPGGAGR